MQRQPYFLSFSISRHLNFITPSVCVCTRLSLTRKQNFFPRRNDNPPRLTSSYPIVLLLYFPRCVCVQEVSFTFTVLAHSGHIVPILPTTGTRRDDSYSLPLSLPPTSFSYPFFCCGGMFTCLWRRVCTNAYLPLYISCRSCLRCVHGDAIYYKKR